MSVHEVLKRYWGYDDFRNPQYEIIQSVVAGNDTLALLPTGAGKSICYQVPIMSQDGMGIVISPLIALMKDQVQNLKKKGINALEIVSGMSAREIDIALDNCIYGNVKFLYLSPERLESTMVQERIKKMNVNLLAVDEAHCISQWGYDFRPSYLNISKVREILPDVPVLALTATATKEVAEDICLKLNFRNARKFQISFERKNLHYLVLKEENKLRRLLKIFDRTPGSAVIYVRNRRQTEEISRFLRQNKITADFYHAGMDMTSRSSKQDAWIHNKIRVIVATNAFGMGIDKPDVRVVVHLDLPESLEAYYQEAGRAGRDGLKSYAVLIYNDADVSELKRKWEEGFPKFEDLSSVYDQLFKYYNIAYGAGKNVQVEFDKVSFLRQSGINIQRLSHTLNFLEKEGVIHLSDEYKNDSRLTFLVNHDGLYTFQVANSYFDPLIKTILRSYGGMFEQYVNIYEPDLIKRSGLETPEFYKQLNLLQNYKIIDYIKGTKLPILTFLNERLQPSHFRFDKSYWKQRNEVIESKTNSMISYVLEHQCRSRLLLSYFGEFDAEPCGHCDVCISNKTKSNKADHRDLIINRLKEESSKDKLSLPFILNTWSDISENIIIENLQILAEEGFIQFNDKNEVILKKST